MKKLLLSGLICLAPLNIYSHRLVEFITYIPSDVYEVTEYRQKPEGVEVLIEDWYEGTKVWYFCPYTADWCFPEFFPTLAVRYGEKLHR